MIAALLLALQAAALQPARPIVVRPSPAVERTVAVEERADGDQFVRADRLAAAFGVTATVASGSTEAVRLRIGGRAFDFVPGVPFVRTGETAIPLSVAPERVDGALWVPIQFVTDVLPREGRGVIYDAARRELRAFSPTVATAPATPPARPTPRAEPPAVTSPDVTERAPVLARPRRSGGAHVVVVDAGHGGIDSGMRGPLGGATQTDEKVITLGIARQLDASLKRRGVAVVMTRTRDTLVALADRGRIANEGNGELFISIHVNAANPSLRNAAAARGFETYFLAEAKSEDARLVAARENESVRFETAGPSTSQNPLDFIISDMAQNEHLRESSRLATLVQRRLIRAHPGPSRGVKQAGFKVLVTASMPAVLVEVGYGTNAEDAAFITSATGQRAIAEAIADAAVEYLARAERTGADAGGAP